MSLADLVERVFDADGRLASLQRGWTERPGQKQMALAVARTMEEGGALVVEAGTGVGKTYAYLVPALLSGEKVLLSTATKTLQDQLFNRDIPRLLSALGIPVRAVMLKGRASYLCTYRLGVARQVDAQGNMARIRDLAQVEAWASATRTGDLAELAVLDESSPIIPLVTSTRENCLRNMCPDAASCHVTHARRAAMEADVVVINHHLFFADLNVRESGVAELLPSVAVVVFDEAHQLSGVGLQFLSRQWSVIQLQHFLRDLSLCGPQLAWGSLDWRAMVVQMDCSCRALIELFDGEHSGRLAWQGAAPVGVDADLWVRGMESLKQSLQAMGHVLDRVEDQLPKLRLLKQRLDGISDLMAVFSTATAPGTVRWVEVGSGVRLFQSPLSIEDAMRSVIASPSEHPKDHRRSWIFTSATLGHDADLSWFVESSGLQGASVLRVDSPFDYARQAALYVPQHLPAPGDERHSDCVALLTAQAAEVLGGRTLVLTTTVRAMRSIGDTLAVHLPASSGIEVLVQGQHPKRALAERFGQSPSNDWRGRVLVACASFWEGFDVPGNALQLVVIDKLPFAPPDDPLIAARAREMESGGKNPFVHLHVPLATVALKQGAGRLIRSETDRGVLVICDVRLTQKGYGRRMLRALPPMRVVSDHEDFMQTVIDLTRVSTTDLCST